MNTCHSAPVSCPSWAAPARVIFDLLFDGKGKPLRPIRFKDWLLLARSQKKATTEDHFRQCVAWLDGRKLITTTSLHEGGYGWYPLSTREVVAGLALSLASVPEVKEHNPSEQHVQGY